MLNLIKYEIKGMKNSVYAILIGIALMFILVFAKVNIMYGAINIVSATIIGFVLVVIAFISAIKVFSRYLYNDDGYLLFTLPANGYEITGSRLITAFCEITVVALSATILFIVASIKTMNSIPQINGVNWWGIAKTFITPSTVSYAIIEYILGVCVFILTIYFSMVIGKTVLPVRRYEKGIAFLAFIVLSIVINLIRNCLEDVWVINKVVRLPQGFEMDGGTMFNISISNSTISFNMGILILDIILFAVLFIGTSKLIDRGIEK